VTHDGSRPDRHATPDEPGPSDEDLVRRVVAGDEGAAGARPAPSRVGTTIGPYRLDAELGAGGMGTVYLATLVVPALGLGAGARVAVKVLHAHLVSRPEFRDRFLREAAIGARVRHENVAATLGSESVLVDGARVDLLAMEYVEGRTLRALLDDLGHVPEGLCRHIGHEVGRALAAIHGEGAVHRDLKPENVLITPDHVVKVMDLGVARLVDEATRISETGAFVGSLPYAAPEQLGSPGRPVQCSSSAEGRKVDVDARADLHALGLTLYELATGVHPFDADDVGTVVRRVLDAVPRPAGELNPQLSPFFEELLARLLEKDRERRPQSAADVARIFAEGEDGAWWKDRAASLRRETRRPLRRIRIPRETALYGRETELALLRSLFERASAGDGQVVLIEGEAGIGKSRLVDEFVGRLAQAGEDVNFLFGSYPPGGAATASGAFSTAYREHFGGDDAAIRAALPQMPLLVPAFSALLRGDVPPEHAEKFTKDSLQTVFVHATRSFAAQRPTIVLIDDLHFAPQEGRALFASLVPAVPGHPILLVGGARPSLDAKWARELAGHPQVTRLVLPRLGPKELVHLLRDALRSERLADELAGLMGVKSDGNPFFVFELLQGLRDGQFLRQRPDGTWETTQVIRDVHVPSSIVELVQGRVADLAVDDKNLLDVAACCGFEFDPLVVAAVLGVGQIPTLQRLARIEQKHRLVRSAGRRFVFDHHQVQEALYVGMPELLREPYHSAIAEAIEARSGAVSREPKDVDGAVCVELAEHFLKGAKGERAHRYLDAALTHLEIGYLNDATIRLCDRALAASGVLAGKERAEVCLRQAACLDLLGRREAERVALEAAQALADLAEDPALGARARNRLGWHFVRVCRYAEAESTLRAALQLARAAGEKKEEAAASGNLANVFWSLGRYAEAQEHYERDLALALETGDRRGEAVATGNLGTVFHSLGRYAEAREHYERSLAFAREMGDRRTEAIATGNLGNVFYALGRYAEAREHYERWVALARETSDRRGEASANGSLGTVFCALGRYAEAREYHERHLAFARESGDRRGEATATGSLGTVFWALGRYAEAREYVERQLALARESGNRWGEAHALGNLGSAHFSLGAAALARQRLEESLSLCREIGARSQEGFALARLADVSDEEGDLAGALGLAGESLALRRTIGHGHGVAESLVLVADLHQRSGEAETARSELTEALQLLHEHGRADEAALALAMLACLSGGDAREAVAALAEAGADKDSARVRWLLWQATRDRSHLVAAKRLLDELLAKVPAEHHAAMLANVRLHREIVAAARDNGLA
jgi:serine/threonine protein kinase/tetratricopeptide (TPR) repeat protein